MNDRPAGRLARLLRFVGALIRNRFAPRFPLLLMHAVTEACNARCPYCVFRHGRRRPDELALEEIGALYRDARALGIQYVHLWGGEPLVHPRIGEIVRLATRAGLVTGLVTNGALLARRADEVLPYVDRLYVSIDYPGQKHNEMRATSGLFDALLGGIEYVRSRWPKQFILASFTLCRDNQDAVTEMAELCRRLRMRLYVNPMRPAALTADGGQGGEAEAAAATGNDRPLEVENEDRIVPWSEQRGVWERLVALKRQGFPVQNTFHYMRQIIRRGMAPRYRCHWPKIALAVDANGDVVDCQDWARPITSIRETPLREIARLPRARALRGRVGEACHACSSPARFEPSRLWGLHPGLLGGALQGLLARG